jgi:hypothetical protein
MADDLVEHLIVQHGRNLVDRISVEALDHRFALHIAEQRDLGFSSSGIWRSARQSRMSGWIPISRNSLTECCVGLVFSSPAVGIYGSKRQMHVAGVVAPFLQPHLADGLKERQRLDVADGTADLDNRHVGTFAPRRIWFLISSVMCGIT